MRFLFDTDHITIRQRRTRPDFDNFVAHAAPYTKEDFAYSIVSFDEQTRGARAHIKAAKSHADLVPRYGLLELLLNDYKQMTVLAFDFSAAAALTRLQSQNLRIGALDLRIAAIAVSRGLILLTRNARDFAKIAGLTIEDWTRDVGSARDLP